MVHCSKGHENPEGQPYCGECGERLMPGPEVSAPNAQADTTTGLVTFKCGYCQAEQQGAAGADSFQCTGCHRTVFFAKCLKCGTESHVDAKSTRWLCSGCGVYTDTPSVLLASRTSEGTAKCPRCGGTSFQPRRKISTKVMFGLSSLAGRPRYVECVTCGAMYRRPN